LVPVKPGGECSVDDNLAVGLTKSNGSLPHPSVHTYATACVLD